MKPILAAALGLLHAWSIAWPFELGLPWVLQLGQPSGSLQLLSLSGLFALLWRDASSLAPSRLRGILRSAALAWAFGTAWLCGTVWWLFISMHTYGGLAAPLAALAVFLLCGFLALYLAAAAAVWRVFFDQNHPSVQVKSSSTASLLIAFASMCLLAELARARLMTGFPWGASGYAHVDSWLAAWAPFIGVYGMGFVAALLAAGFAALWVRRTRIAGAAVLASVLALTGVAQIAQPYFTRVQLQDAISLELLQGNVAQHEKFVRKGIADALDWYASRALASTSQLVIAPETAIPLLPSDLPSEYLPALQKKFKGEQQLLIGAPLMKISGYTNSVLGIGADGGQIPYRYDKHHLVPFGEFIPPLFKWFVRMMNIPLGDFDRGAIAQAPFVVNGQRFLPNICYEDLYGEELAASFTNPSTAPHVMVNFSNIGWFGTGIAVDQHLHISRMRSLEFARPMVRATNTGMTAVIDHKGQVTAQLARATAGTLKAQVQGSEGATGRVTPYASWAGRFGVRPLLGLALTLLAASYFIIHSNKHNKH